MLYPNINAERSRRKLTIEEFAKAIQYFWQLRVNSLFPSRDIVVEIGEEIMGEEGLTVTLYQKGQSK